MEREDAGVDAEQRVPAQHFYVSVLEVEGVMRSHGCGVDWRFLIRGVRDCEVGETGDAYGRGLSNGSYGDCVYFWSDDRTEWGRRWLGLKDLRFGIPARESQGCGDRSGSGVSLTCSFLFHRREYRRRREALPAAVP